MPLMLSFQNVFLVLGLVGSVPFLIWYYRRQPHPRFRPKLGEMAMMSLFAALLSLGGSYLIGGLMDDPEQFRPDASLRSLPGLPSKAQDAGVMEERERPSRGRSESDRSSGSRGSDARN